MKGKCGGGKSLGISLNFPSEKELLAYINKNYKACAHCYKICRPETMPVVLVRDAHLCTDCAGE